VLRLEERLSYTHKGIESAETLPWTRAIPRGAFRRYTVAYAGLRAGARGHRRREHPAAPRPRALVLERERVANHPGISDIWATMADSLGLAQFSRLKEDVRTNLVAFGHRLAMDHVIPAASRATCHRNTRSGLAKSRSLEREIRIIRTSMTSTRDPGQVSDLRHVSPALAASSV
jgi:hypothetical protein